MAGNGENGEAPTLLWERPEIRLEKNLDRLFGGINLDTNRRIAEIYFMAWSVLSSNDGVGPFCHGERGILKNRVEAARFVLGAMKLRMAALRFGWADVTATQVYTIFDIHPGLRCRSFLARANARKRT